MEEWTLTSFGWCTPPGKPCGRSTCYHKPVLYIYSEKQSCQEIRTLTTFGQFTLFLEWWSLGIELQSEDSSGNPPGQLGCHLFQLDDHYIRPHTTLCPTRTIISQARLHHSFLFTSLLHPLMSVSIFYSSFYLQFPCSTLTVEGAYTMKVMHPPPPGWSGLCNLARKSLCWPRLCLGKVLHGHHEHLSLLHLCFFAWCDYFKKKWHCITLFWSIIGKGYYGKFQNIQKEEKTVCFSYTAPPRSNNYQITANLVLLIPPFIPHYL